MGLTFEWDERKAKSNYKKHKVTFEEAATVFGNPFSLTIVDPLHSTPLQKRFVIVGQTLKGKIVVVVHCEDGNTIRIISARISSRQERRNYEESK